MISISEDLRQSFLQNVQDALDGGVTPATISIYTGTRPGNGVAVTSQILLVTLIMQKPCSSSGPTTDELVFDLPISGSAVASGKATWARFKDGDGNFVMDASVGTYDSVDDVKLTTVNVQLGATVTATEAKFQFSD